MPGLPAAQTSRPIAVHGASGHTGRFVLAELRRRGMPAVAVGRSAQRFEMAVRARQGDALRTAVARGQDIYAVSAPLVVEAAARLMEPGFARCGALAMGQAFDAPAFLRALSPQHLDVALPA